MSHWPLPGWERGILKLLDNRGWAASRMWKVDQSQARSWAEVATAWVAWAQLGEDGAHIRED